MRKPLFIAEVSSNHHRDLDRCRRFIDRAASAGFDAVKFQLFRIDRLFAPEVLARSQAHRRRREWELPLDFLPLLAEHCALRQVAFACTPFYLEAVDQLAPHVDFFKIASYELTWPRLLRACAATGKPVILSTGMADLAEVTDAVQILREAGAEKVTLLHCSSAYPTPPREANLAAVETIRAATGCPVGWSDHTRSPAVLYRAVHRWGAEVVELHLDLDGKGEEYAAGHCWLPQEIAPVIRTMRESMLTDGHGRKEPNAAELPDRDWRADPEDGLRPFKAVRADFQGDEGDPT
ncbi:MAG: N-acetylneuraminate synthase family protein [Acidobacteriota bacterium]|nr:N-acetylneuraminate synthase family protein [Acidobacteriota bacterium]